MSLNRPVTIFNVGVVRIGQGVVLSCAEDFAARGATSVLLVTTPPTRGLCAPLIAALESRAMSVTVWDALTGEPTIENFHDALATTRACGADAVIGLGGGSAMDVAKLVAALADGRQGIDEVIGVDLLAGRALPLACVPTTAGTGSEVTPIAILGDEEEDLKKGVVSPWLIPDFAYLDPELTVSMPRAVTASTGVDALTHCIEAYANRFAHPVVDIFALEGISLIASHLERACADGTDLVAREAMLRASYYGGLCLGPVNTAAVHALAYPLGGEFHIPHGVANSILLPHVLRFNLAAAPGRYAAIARAMGIPDGPDDEATARAGIEFVADLSARVGIPAGLSGMGISANAIPRMASSAMKVTRLLERNLRDLTEEDAARIYEAAL
ncbi:alcohol dehydrogenase [Sphingobium sp. SYK-6]|uniref:iron-containing alcohol dehydrogenase n=1 Tax=Sphingobium sp. (strain NBRC 103272 / SYK-6) TaxID=627192 RepID=UPI0002276D6B|nr:iron-containing alcohol dehydrogenase [Sphingobium sp. SYK-6]BAK64989.1 alcohol dehydrogenase [Sphingobium sp. SYK-6]